MGLRPPILIAGNLTTRRAIIDVRDMVRGLWLASERCELGDVYNVGATAIYSVEELIEAVRLGVRNAIPRRTRPGADARLRRAGDRRRHFKVPTPADGDRRSIFARRSKTCSSGGESAWRPVCRRTVFGSGESFGHECRHPS